MFAPEDTVVVSPHQVSCPVGDDIVVMAVREGAYFGLKGVATFLWTLLQQPMTVEALRSRVIAEYDVNPERAALDIEKFLADLQEAELLEVRRADAS
jgi:hypothetical protein